jgi:hypothetical protein
MKGTRSAALPHVHLSLCVHVSVTSVVSLISSRNKTLRIKAGIGKGPGRSRTHRYATDPGYNSHADWAIVNASPDCCVAQSISRSLPRSIPIFALACLFNSAFHGSAVLLGSQLRQAIYLGRPMDRGFHRAWQPRGCAFKERFRCEKITAVTAIDLRSRTTAL